MRSPNEMYLLPYPCTVTPQNGACKKNTHRSWCLSGKCHVICSRPIKRQNRWMRCYSLACVPLSFSCHLFQHCKTNDICYMYPQIGTFPHATNGLQHSWWRTLFWNCLNSPNISRATHLRMCSNRAQKLAFVVKFYICFLFLPPRVQRMARKESL